MRPIWWLKPHIIFPLLVTATSAVAWNTPRSIYLIWKTEKYFDLHFFLLAIAASIFFLLGHAINTAFKIPTKSANSLSPAILAKLEIVTWGGMTLVLLGYAVWMWAALKSGVTLSLVKELILDPTNGACYRLRESLQTVPGLSTCTQFAPITVVMLTIFINVGRRRRINVMLLTLLLSLAAIRALLNSERLALLELLVPIAITGVLNTNFRSAKWRLLLPIAPVLGFGLVVAFFGGLEYFRSWQHYKRDYDSYSIFVISRFSSYFCTALNNSALVFYEGERPALPYFTMAFWWRFPLNHVWGLDYQSVTGLPSPREQYHLDLDMYGTAELNNASGLFAPLLDYGYLGFGIYWCLFGTLISLFARFAFNGLVVGRLFYPIFFVALVEVPRVSYLTSQRTLPSLLLGILALIILSIEKGGRYGDRD